MTERREQPRFVQRLEARREAYATRGRVYKGLWVLAGAVVTLAGVAMLALPGPAFVVIPIGLAMLSLQFEWAANALERALDKAADAREKAAATTPAQKALTAALGVLAAAAAVVAAVLWDIPLLPV